VSGVSMIEQERTNRAVPGSNIRPDPSNEHRRPQLYVGRGAGRAMTERRSGPRAGEEAIAPRAASAAVNRGDFETAPTGDVDDFDFLVGRWNVRHRRLVGRLVGSTTWEDFDGDCVMRKLLGGQANVDDNVLRAPAGTYRAMTIRVFDPSARQWSIYWIDSRYPPERIEDPVVGGFAGDRGLFFADGDWEGRLVRTRFLWQVDGPDSCRWEQAASIDGGLIWETNWYMDFERAAS
jgi:hypothetical protein